VTPEQFLAILALPSDSDSDLPGPIRAKWALCERMARLAARAARILAAPGCQTCSDKGPKCQASDPCSRARGPWNPQGRHKPGCRCRDADGCVPFQICNQAAQTLALWQGHLADAQRLESEWYALSADQRTRALASDIDRVRLPDQGRPIGLQQGLARLVLEGLVTGCRAIVTPDLVGAPTSPHGRIAQQVSREASDSDRTWASWFLTQGLPGAQQGLARMRPEHTRPDPAPALAHLCGPKEPQETWREYGDRQRLCPGCQADRETISPSRVAIVPTPMTRSVLSADQVSRKGRRRVAGPDGAAAGAARLPTTGPGAQGLESSRGPDPMPQGLLATSRMSARARDLAWSAWGAARADTRQPGQPD